MEINQQIIATGDDSWEAEMTFHNITYKVEATLADRKGQSMWWLEVLKPASKWTVIPIHAEYYPTLEEAIEGAKSAIATMRK